MAATPMVTTDEVVAGLVPNVAVMPVGQPDAARVTGEVKPLAGVTVTVDVPADPGAAVATVALIVKLGAALTVSEIVLFADNVPLVPVTARTYCPGATLAATPMATTEEAAAGLVPKVAVMPVGQPDATRVTAELNPLAGVIVTVDVPADPAVAAAEVTLKVKL